MFRKMRRYGQALSREECIDILKNASHGVLALHGDDDYPYAVPMSYVYENDKLYFHGARSGHRMDSVMKDEKASFCVVSADDVIPEEYATYYKSVIVFGRIRALTGKDEIISSAETLAEKYNPGDTPEGRLSEIDKEFSRLAMFEMTVEHMTGKQARGLVPETGQDGI